MRSSDATRKNNGCVSIVGAIIHYALAPIVYYGEGVMNYGPYMILHHRPLYVGNPILGVW